MPGVMWAPIASAALRTAPRSGPPSSASGVGTHTRTTSARATTDGSSGRLEASGQAATQVVVGDVVDVGVAGVEPVHGRGISVEAVDLQPRLGGTQRHGESDIALADDDERGSHEFSLNQSSVW